MRLLYVSHNGYIDYNGSVIWKCNMVQVNLAQAESSFSEYANRAAYTNENIIITKRGKPFVARISVKDLEFLEKI